MATFVDKPTLKAAVISNMYGRSDIEQQFDTFVALTEECLEFGSEDFPALRCREMQAVATIPFALGVGALPEDYLQYRSLVDQSTSPYRPLNYMTPDQFDLKYPSRNAGPASNWTVHGDEIIVAPYTTGNVVMNYYARISPLTNLDTNAIFDRYGGLYFRGCLFHAAEWVKDDMETQKQLRAFRSLIMGINKTDFMSNYANAGVEIGGLVV